MFENVGMVPFFESLKGYNEKLMAKFMNSWKKGFVTIGVVKFEVTTSFIAEAMGLQNNGIKVEKRSGVD